MAATLPLRCESLPIGAIAASRPSLERRLAISSQPESASGSTPNNGIADLRPVGCLPGRLLPDSVSQLDVALPELSRGRLQRGLLCFIGRGIYGCGRLVLG